MVQVAKTKEMKGSFNEQFASVHELCLMVLNASTRTDLIKATLMTLNSFLSWVPLGYILESNMVDILLGLVSKEAYRYVCDLFFCCRWWGDLRWNDHKLCCVSISLSTAGLARRARPAHRPLFRIDHLINPSLNPSTGTQPFNV